MSPRRRFCNSSRQVPRSTRHLRRSSVKPPGRAWAILKKSFLRKSKTISQTHKCARRGKLVCSFTAIPWRWCSDKMRGIGRRSPWTLLDRVDYRILISTMLTASRMFQPQIGSMPAKTAKSNGTTLNWYKSRKAVWRTRRSASPTGTSRWSGWLSTSVLMPPMSPVSGSSASKHYWPFKIHLLNIIGTPSHRSKCLPEPLMKNSTRSWNMNGQRKTISPISWARSLPWFTGSLPGFSRLRKLLSSRRRRTPIFPSQWTPTRPLLLSGWRSGSLVAPVISTWRKRMPSFSRTRARRIVCWTLSVLSSKKGYLCITPPSSNRLPRWMFERLLLVFRI